MLRKTDDKGLILGSRLDAEAGTRREQRMTAEWPEIDVCTPLPVRGDGSKIHIIPAGETAREKYGYRYGAQVFELPQNCVKALLEGKQLAFDILDEYVLFLYI